jgi:ribosomal protein L37AE/L43A
MQNSEQKPLCPYCNKDLAKYPTRKTKCKSCGNYYYLKTDFKTRIKTIVTEDTAIKMEQEWVKGSLISSFKSGIKNIIIKNESEKSGFGISFLTPNILKFLNKTKDVDKEEYDYHFTDIQFDRLYGDVKKNLSDKFGYEAKEGDILWSIANNLVLLISKKGDLSELSTLHSIMGYYLDGCGKNATHLFKISSELKIKNDVLNYEKANIKEVEIATYQDISCFNCNKNSGKRISINKVFDFLPCKECTNVINKNTGTIQCKCTTIPVFE